MAKKEEKNNNIVVRGARVNNLKNINVELPRGKFIAVSYTHLTLPTNYRV